MGAPLREFQGVLTGVPQYVGEAGPLMRPSEGMLMTAEQPTVQPTVQPTDPAL